MSGFGCSVSFYKEYCNILCSKQLNISLNYSHVIANHEYYSFMVDRAIHHYLGDERRLVPMRLNVVRPFRGCPTIQKITNFCISFPYQTHTIFSQNRGYRTASLGSVFSKAKASLRDCRCERSEAILSSVLSLRGESRSNPMCFANTSEIVTAA